MKFDLLLSNIKAATFFPKYAPGVKNWAHKARGKNGHGNPIEFTPEDGELIRKGIDMLRKDILARMAKETAS